MRVSKIGRRWSWIGTAAMVVTACWVGGPARAAGPPTSVDLAWVTVGNPGNPADTEVMAADRTSGYGAVDHEYRIGKYDVTNTEYAAFLNAVARRSDPYLLYFPCMDRTQCYGVGSGIERTGTKSGYTYAAQPGRERRPVNYVNLFSAMRFANWMHNGQGSGSTERGAYTLLGGTVIPTNFLTVHRNPGAKVFLPSEDEWYKAAYYDGKAHRYYDFPAGTDRPMACTLPTTKPNTANCDLVTAKANPANPGLPSVSAWFFGDVTDVGAYPGSPSPYGTFDQGGNLFQWTEELSFDVITQYHAGSNAAGVLDGLFAITGNPITTGLGPCGIVRGTDWGDAGKFNHANGRTCDVTADPFETYGFRLAARP